MIIENHKFKISVVHYDQTISIEAPTPQDIHELMEIMKAIVLAMGYHEKGLTDYWNDGNGN